MFWFFSWIALLFSVISWFGVGFGGTQYLEPAIFFSVTFFLIQLWGYKVWPYKCPKGWVHKPKRFTGQYDGIETWHEECTKCGKNIAHGNYYGLGESHYHPK